LFKDHGDQLIGQLGGQLGPAMAGTTSEATPGIAVPAAGSALILDRLRAIRTSLETQYHRLELHHDLAEEIGSARWFRGLGTMLALAIGAFSFWPDFSAVEPAHAATTDSAARDELRSQMILPLGQGADSGRRMAPSVMVVPIASAPERPMLKMVATLGAGDSLSGMLQRAGVGSDDALQAAALITARVPAAQIEPGTRFDVVLGKRPVPGAPRPLQKLDFRAKFDLALGIERNGAGLSAVSRPIAVDTTPLRIRGPVGASLYRSARAAGAPVKAIQQYLQTLDAHLSLDAGILPSDEFDLIVSYKRSANGESETGQLVYAGLIRGGKPVTELVRMDDGRFYESGAASGGEQSAATFAPVAGRITSNYGLRRHPILGYSRMHAGVDFGAPWGSPIFAVSSGVVSFAGRHGGHGNYVRLEHGGGLGTGYGHMSRIAVSPGTMVQAGQVIGYVGSTGLSTGPHLHYEVYQNGRTVNPLSVRFTMKAQIDPKQQAEFKAKLARIKEVTPGAALKSLPGTKKLPLFGD